MTEREIRTPAGVAREIRERSAKIKQAGIEFMDEIERCEVEPGREFFGYPVIHAQSPDNFAEVLPRGMRHTWKAIFKTGEGHGIVEVSRFGGSQINSLDTVSIIHNTGDRELRQVYASSGILLEGPAVLPDLADISVSLAAGTLPGPKRTEDGSIDFERPSLDKGDSKKGSYHKPLPDYINPKSVLSRFHREVIRLCDGGESPYADRNEMLKLMQLTGSQPDGLLFGQRFAHNILRPEVYAMLTAENGNKAKLFSFNPPLRGVNAMLNNLERGKITQPQAAYLDALLVTTEQQLSREGEGKFCDMGADFVLRVIQIDPTFVDDRFRSRVLYAPPPKSDQRVFTNTQKINAEYAGDLIA